MADQALAVNGVCARAAVLNNAIKITILKNVGSFIGSRGASSPHLA
jgi:hypothetical protein